MKYLRKYLRPDRLLILCVLVIGTTFTLGCKPKSVEWSSVSADDLLYQIRSPLHENTAISGAAAIIHETPDGLRKGRAYFALKASNQLLLEAVTPSDETVAVLVTNGDNFMGFEVSDTHCRTGPPCAANVALIFPLPLDGIQVVRLLFGRPPLIAGESSDIERMKTPPRNRLFIEGGRETRQILDFTANGKDLISAKIDRAGKEILDIRYSEHFDLTDKIRLPRQIELHDAVNAQKVTIRVIDADLFTPKPETFDTHCPKGKIIEFLPCGPDANRPH